jgi:transposase
MDFPLLLDPELEYISSETIDEKIIIYVQSKRIEVNCTYCQCPSTKVHMRYNKSFDDLPIQGRKVEIRIKNKNYFCLNPQCSHKTFAETFGCLHSKAKKTIRLENEILSLSMEMSSISAAKYLNQNIVGVSKSTICRLIEKKTSQSIKATL